jgi:uncharacterized protein YPO0396
MMAEAKEDLKSKLDDLFLKRIDLTEERRAISKKIKRLQTTKSHRGNLRPHEVEELLKLQARRREIWDEIRRVNEEIKKIAFPNLLILRGSQRQASTETS